LPTTWGNRYDSPPYKIVCSMIWTLLQLGFAVFIGVVKIYPAQVKGDSTADHVTDLFGLTIAQLCYIWILCSYSFSLGKQDDTWLPPDPTHDRQEEMYRCTFKKKREVLAKLLSDVEALDQAQLTDFDEMFAGFEEHFEQKQASASTEHERKVHSLSTLSMFLVMVVEPQFKPFFREIAKPPEDRSLTYRHDLLVAEQELAKLKASKAIAEQIVEAEKVVQEKKELLEVFFHGSSASQTGPSLWGACCAAFIRTIKVFGFLPETCRSYTSTKNGNGSESMQEAMQVRRDQTDATHQEEIQAKQLKEEIMTSTNWARLTLRCLGVIKPGDTNIFFFPTVVIFTFLAVSLYVVVMAFMAENQYALAKEGLTSISHSIKNVNIYINMTERFCPGLYAMPADMFFGVTMANATVGDVAPTLSGKLTTELAHQLDGVIGDIAISWRLATVATVVFLLYTALKTVYWYRKIALECEAEGSTHRHFARFGVEWPEFVETVQPNMTASMSAQFFGNFSWSVVTCFSGIFVVLLLLFTAVVNPAVWKLLLGEFLSIFSSVNSFWATFLSTFTFVGGILLLQVGLSMIMDNVCTKMEMQFSNDMLPRVVITRPVLFCCFYPLMVMVYWVMAPILATKVLILYVWVTLKTLLRHDRTVIREGGYNLDSLFMPFMATIEFFHNHKSE